MEKIPALTGLRFFAAAAIVLWHSQTDYFLGAAAFEPFYLAGAVALFFVLSGFVLTISADKYRSRSDFFAARIARIWPAHVAALIFWLLLFMPGTVTILQRPGSGEHLILNALLLHAWLPDPETYWSFNAPSWSVSSELFLYVAFPVCAVIFSRLAWLRLPSLVVVAVSAIILTARAFPALDANWLGAVNPLAGLGAFAMGVAAGLVHKRLTVAKCPCGRATALQTAAVALAIAANALFPHYGFSAVPALRAHIAMFGAAPFYAALVLTLARYDGLLSRGLSLPLIVYGGEISYSLYLFHQPIIIRWGALNRLFFAGSPMWWQYASVLILSLATAAIAHARVEKIGRRLVISAWSRARGLTSETARQ